MQFIDMQKLIKKYLKDYDKNKESSYWDVYNSLGWKMSQKLPVNDFEWIVDTSQFNEVFIKSYNEESNERCFLEIDVQYPEKLYGFHNYLLLLPKRMKLNKSKSLLLIYMIETEYVIHIRNSKQALNHG